MRALLTRGQLLLMRAIGMRKLREGLDARSDAALADLAGRLDMLLAEIAFRGGPSGDPADWPNSRLEALGNQMSQQGKADTERGDTIQKALADLRAAVSELHAELNRQATSSPEQGAGVGQALGEIRVEMSSMRADLARENEVLLDRIDGGGASQGCHARAS